jgi:hypothetical protein
MKNLVTENEVQLSELQIALDNADFNYLLLNIKGGSFKKILIKELNYLFNHVSLKKQDLPLNDLAFRYNSINLFLDSFTMSYFLQRIKKSKEINKSLYNLILLDDHEIVFDDVLSSNFSFGDIGKEVSDVLSSRYSVPITSLSRSLYFSKDLFAIFSSVSTIVIDKNFSGINTKVNHINDLSSSSCINAVNIVCSYENSLLINADKVVDFVNKPLSIIEFTGSSTKIYFNSIKKEFNTESLTRSEFFENFFLNFSNFISGDFSENKDFLEEDFLISLSIQKKTDNKIINIDFQTLMVMEYVKIIESSIAINKNFIENSIFENGNSYGIGSRYKKFSSYDAFDRLTRILFPLHFVPSI